MNDSPMERCCARAVLFHLEAPNTPDGSRRKRRHRLYDTLVTLEGELFKEGGGYQLGGEFTMRRTHSHFPGFTQLWRASLR
jgi:hypothetical protein